MLLRKYSYQAGMGQRGSMHTSACVSVYVVNQSDNQSCEGKFKARVHLNLFQKHGCKNDLKTNNEQENIFFHYCLQSS